MYYDYFIYFSYTQKIQAANPTANTTQIDISSLAPTFAVVVGAAVPDPVPDVPLPVDVAVGAAPGGIDGLKPGASMYALALVECTSTNEHQPS